MTEYTSNFGWTMGEAYKRVDNYPNFMVNHLQFDWDNFQLGRFQLSYFERALLYIIEKQNIETFVFCDENSHKDDGHFWEKAVSKAIPNMLRWLFVNSLKVEFSVSCYVNVGSRALVFTSGSLIVEHFHDVNESVVVLCTMLYRRIDNYLFLNCGVRLGKCNINGFRLNVKRTDDFGDIEKGMTLPVQYRNLLVQQAHTTPDELMTINAIMANHFMDIRCPMPSEKFYRLVESPQTKELSMMPHQTEDTQHSNQHKKNYVIVTDILGNFKNVLEISDPLTCGEERTTTSICDQCERKFNRRTSFEIHQQLKCGQYLNVDTLHPEFVEVFENCLPISRSMHNYSWYGISKIRRVVETCYDDQSECSMVDYEH